MIVIVDDVPCPTRTYVIHAGTVISTKQPYRVVVTLFDTSKPAGGGAGDSFLLQRALPATVGVRLSNKGSVIAEEMRECYPDTTVSVSFKVPDISYIHSLGGVIKLSGCRRWIGIPKLNCSTFKGASETSEGFLVKAVAAQLCATFKYKPYENFWKKLQTQPVSFHHCDPKLSDHDALEHSLYLEVEGNHYGGYHGSLFRHRRQIKVLRPKLSIRVDTNRRTYSPGSRGKQTETLLRTDHPHSIFPQFCV